MPEPGITSIDEGTLRLRAICGATCARATVWRPALSAAYYRAAGIQKSGFAGTIHKIVPIEREPAINFLHSDLKPTNSVAKASGSNPQTCSDRIYLAPEVFERKGVADARRVAIQ